MKFSLTVIVLLMGSIPFVGCGSDSDSDASDTLAAGGANSTTLSVSAVTTNTVCDPAKMKYDYATIDTKYAAEGDITVECQTQGGFTWGDYKLKEGVNVMTITQLEKVENRAGTVTENGKTYTGSGTITYDYKTGRVHHKLDFTGMEVDCVETYPSILPTTVNNEEGSIDILFDWEGNEEQRISTTCPKSYYDESDDDGDDDRFKGHMDSIVNYTITDGDGKQHLVTETMSLVGE